MNDTPPLRGRAARTAALLLLMLAGTAVAAPGAHGPNGEHLDGPAQRGGTSGAPRLEASSELFELVATLGASGLSVFVDRYDTNEPVLGANLEVETGALKAVAKFQADQGAYALDDPRLLQALARPGEHALVFTITAGQQSDLLDGTLRVGAAQAAAGHDGDGHSHLFTPRRAAAAGAVLLVAALAAAVALRRRRQARGGLR